MMSSLFEQRFAPALARALPQQRDDRLNEAMRYALNGGKRLRAQLVYATGEWLNSPLPALDAAAVAIELIHAYSLVHDDLPAMDNDDLRRGQPTVHRAYDEATAILAGDALQSLAFEVLVSSDSPAERRLAQIQTLAVAAGWRGMCGGQQKDMAAEGQTLSLAALEQLHREKTGALLQASFSLAGPIPPTLARVSEWLGLAYQIQDDCLDATQSSADLGKTAGKDAASGKSTFVSLMGLEAAQAQASALFAECLRLCPQPSTLHTLIEGISQRRA